MILAVEFPLFPPRASTLASSVDHVYFFLLGLTAFFSTLIFLCIAYFAIKYRRRSDADQPAEIHGSVALEIVWTAIPLVIVMFIFGWGVQIFYRRSRPPADAMTVYVVGKQWMWKVQHPEGKSEIDALHVPVGVPVRLLMTSEDVIHDFSIPAFRIKQDVLPGRYTSEWFQATQTGDFHLFCAQYCGTLHAGMVGHVVVMEPAEFQAWLAEPPQTPSMAQSGQRLFATLNCATCHADPRKAPALAGRFGSIVTLADGRSSVVDAQYLRESILTPRSKLVAGFPPVMPAYQGQLNETQVMELVAYIESLRPPTGRESIGPEKGREATDSPNGALGR